LIFEAKLSQILDNNGILPLIESNKIGGTCATPRLTGGRIWSKCRGNARALRHNPRHVQACAEYEEHGNHVNDTIPEWILRIEVVRSNCL